MTRNALRRQNYSCFSVHHNCFPGSRLRNVVQDKLTKEPCGLLGIYFCFTSCSLFSTGWLLSLPPSRRSNRSCGKLVHVRRLFMALRLVEWGPSFNEGQLRCCARHNHSNPGRKTTVASSWCVSERHDIHCRQTTLKSAQERVRGGCFLASLDLEAMKAFAFSRYLRIFLWCDLLIGCVKSVEREVTENTTWIEEDLLEYRQLTFEVDFEVSFPSENCCPLLDVSSYQRKEHSDRRCFHQIETELLWVRGLFWFKVSEDDRKNLDVICKENAEKHTCVGSYKASFYEPKMVRYSIGFPCSEKRNLFGMVYSFHFRNVANSTVCERLSEPQLSLPCSDYHLWTTMPNLLGHKTQTEAARTLDILTTVVRSLKDPSVEPCYKFANQILCSFFFSPCVPGYSDRSRLPVASDTIQTNATQITVDRITTICREMCEEFVVSCSGFLSPVIDVSECEYYQPYNESTSCLWEPVTCSSPPGVPNGTLVQQNESFRFPLGSNVSYQCEGKNKGSVERTCKISGLWSKNENCQSSEDRSKIVVIASVCAVLLLVVVISIVVTWFYIRRRSAKASQSSNSEDLETYPKRNRPFDSFVSYYSENCSRDRSFVRSVLQPRLEQQVEPPFRLIFHERDFAADKLIYANIVGYHVARLRQLGVVQRRVRGGHGGTKEGSGVQNLCDYDAGRPHRFGRPILVHGQILSDQDVSEQERP